MEYASKNVAGAGLGLGIAGTSLGLLNGGLGNLLGGMGGNACGCSENQWVNRYEAEQQAKIAALETEVKLRDANFYTVSEMGKLRDYVDGRFSSVEREICDQKVFNATNVATISCIQGQVQQLLGITKMVVPNSSVCPGWGDVTITPATTTTTAG